MRPIKSLFMQNQTLRQITSSISFRLGIIVVLTLLLLIPANMVRQLIKERQYTRNEVVYDIHSSWGNEQVICGPILSIPYLETVKSGKETTVYKRTAHFLPDELIVNGQVDPEIRYRGIYEVVVYKSLLRLNGSFPAPDLSHWKVGKKDILWDEAYISLGIPDMRGITETIEIELGDTTYKAKPGLSSRELFNSGVSVDVSFNGEHPLPFGLDLHLNGSELLGFIPVGKETRVRLESGWSTPSFNGAFLPKEREITGDGFLADWQVFDLNRNFSQAWTGSAPELDNWMFGVNLLFPVDPYLKSERSAKYALMFLALTFLVFFISEIYHKKRVHPVQYLLVGFALIIFYTLLISLAEHIGFNLAYLLASVAVILLITTYVRSIFRSGKVTALVLGSLVLLYSFLFVILQLADYALLIGSIGLFIVLTLVMYVSRKVSFYSQQ